MYSNLNILSDDEKILISEYIPSYDINMHQLDIDIVRIVDELVSMDPSFDLMQLLAVKREHLLQINRLRGTLVSDIYNIINISGGFYVQDDRNGHIYVEVQERVYERLVSYLGDRFTPCPSQPTDTSLRSGHISIEDTERFLKDMVVLHGNKPQPLGSFYHAVVE